MKTVEQVRKERLAMLVKEAGGTYANLNRITGKSATDATFSQIGKGAPDSKSGRPRTMGSVLARDLERAMGKPIGWMDTDPSLTSAAWPFDNISPEQYEALPERIKGRAEQAVLTVIQEWTQSKSAGAA